MVWSQTIPTKSGWYWFRLIENKKASIVPALVEVVDVKKPRETRVAPWGGGLFTYNTRSAQGFARGQFGPKIKEPTGSAMR